jgi:SAM-dependent methyltransferase
MPPTTPVDTSAKTFTIDGVEFVQGFMGTSTSGRFVITKQGPILDAYVGLLGESDGHTMVELGIYAGGSTALAVLLGNLKRLIAVDISEPELALERFLDDRVLRGSVHTHYRLDQSDRVGLLATVQGDLGGDSIDIVIDDASHLLPETWASFETLFPLLRPGGRYIIEDWCTSAVAVQALVELLDDEDAAAAALRDGHWLFNSTVNGSLISPSMSAALRELVQGDSPLAARARAVVDRHSLPVDLATRRNLASIGADLVAVAGARPGVIERVEVDKNWITITRGPDDLPTEGWTLLRHPGEAEVLLGCGPLGPIAPDQTTPAEAG